LAGLAGLTWLEEQAERLDLLYVQVKQAWFGARLAPENMKRCCLSSSRWWPNARWMSTSRRNSCSRFIAAAGRPMR
jgi:hypothetical protein